MSNKLKELNEKRTKLLVEAKALDTTKADDRTKLSGIYDEVTGIDSALELEARGLALQSQSAPSLSKTEERDVGRFDLAKTLRHMDAVMRGQHSVLDGVERELTQEGDAEARASGIKITGVSLPRMLVRRQGFERENRDMTATGGTGLNQGGMTIATQKRGLADDFYNGSVLRQNGALVLEGLTGNLDLPRYVAGTNPTKKAENANADETSPTTAQLSLQPRRLPAFIDISDQLLMQSSVPLESYIRYNLTLQMLSIQEVAFFHGGGTNEPTGIAATAGIGSVVGGTNGAAPDWADIVDLETAVSVVNAAMGNLHYITNSKVRGKLKKTQKAAGTDSKMIWEGGDLNGYSPLVTNAVSSTLTKGSSSVASAIFFGNLNDFVIGYWGGLMLEMVRDTAGAKAGQRTLVANTYYDGGVLRPKSFAAMLDALTA